LPESDEEQVF
jgi:hypothetical protein